MDKIIDGNDIAHEYGLINYEAFLKGFGELMRKKGVKTFKSWKGMTCNSPALKAYINGGRWLTVCSCGNYGYVTAQFPYYFCAACGNATTGGAAAPVEFPVDKEQIEKLLLMRPVQAGSGDRPTQAAKDAIPLVPGLRRDWYPGQTVEWLGMKNSEAGLCQNM